MSLRRQNGRYNVLWDLHRAVSAFVLISGLAISPVQGQAGTDRYEYRQTRMGMPTRVVLYAPNDSTARRAGQSAFRVIQNLETIFSTYRSSSELNRLSRRSGEGPISVSRPLFSVLRRAQRLGHRSDGAFDVTVGPFITLWREAQRTGERPDSSALQRASARVGWSHVHLAPEEQTVRLTADSMQLNLGGIAKGYILDRALDTLSAQGISSAMIEAGGDLVVSGAPPNQEGWAVRLPNTKRAGLPDTLHLEHAAVSTSGDTHQFVEINGTRYSHVVDPRTGLGLTQHLLVTIVAPNGVTADGLATTVGILGPTAGREFLAEYYPSVQAYVRPARDSQTSP